MVGRGGDRARARGRAFRGGPVREEREAARVATCRGGVVAGMLVDASEGGAEAVSCLRGSHRREEADENSSKRQQSCYSSARHVVRH